MATVLRVLPTTIYDRLLAEGIIDAELLKDKIILKSSLNKPPFEIVPKAEEEIDNQISSHLDSSQARNFVDSESPEEISQLGGSFKKNFNWITFEQNHKLI
jgi:hypothetical protein